MQADGSQVAAQATDWVAAERRGPSAGKELRRLFRRALARPVWTFGSTLALALLAAAYLAARPAVHEARVVLRVSQGEIGGGHLAPPRELREYVSEVTLSTSRLRAIVDKWRLYPGLRARDPILAVARLRDDLRVTVASNYFLEYRDHAAPASARIILDVRAGDPDLAFAVAQDLARLLTESEEQERQRVTAVAAEEATRAAEEARARLSRRERQLAELQMRLRKRERPDDEAALRVAIVGLESAIRAGNVELSGLEQREQEVILQRDLEAHRLGLKLEVTQMRQPFQSTQGSQRLILLGAVVFLLCLPLCAMAVGAFDARIRSAEDVSRLGLVVLGHEELR